MVASTLIFILLAQERRGTPVDQAPTPAAPAPAPFFEPMDIPDKTRLAMTPKIDGIRGSEEWDPLAKQGDVETYLQWEPKKLHLAGKLPTNQDLVWSFDLDHNGWLVGRDNLEIRITKGESGPVVKARMLDARHPSGPVWNDIPSLGIASTIAATEDPVTNTWFVEATVEEPGLNIFPVDTEKLMVRADAMPRDAAEREPFLPRALQEVNLAFDRVTGLPENLTWKPEGQGQSVTIKSPVKIRLTFKGKNELGLRKIQLRSEGEAESVTNSFEYVFPKFDDKGRAFVDYNTIVDPETSFGYKVLRATITSKDGATAVGQVSYRVAPVLDFDLVNEPLRTQDSPQTVRLTVFVRSNTRNKVNGTMRILPPDDFELGGVSGRTFVIYNAKGSVRRVFDLTVPPKAKGTYPFSIQGELGDRTVAQTVYITVR